jgi:hypothetical protein
LNAARAPQGGDAAVSATAILALALPSSTMFLLATLVGIAMIRFAAALGPDAVAAVNAGARLYNVFIALAAGINAGALALIANAWGAGRRDEAERYLALSLAVAALLGAAITLLTWLGAGPLLGLFDLDPGAHTESVSYTRWLALFYAPIALYLVLASGLRAAGDARTPMLFALLVNGVSLGLAWRWSIAPPFGLQPHVRYIALGLGLGNVAGVVAALALWRARTPGARPGAPRCGQPPAPEGTVAGGLPGRARAGTAATGHHRVPVGGRAVRHRGIHRLRHQHQPAVARDGDRLRLLGRGVGDGRATTRRGLARQCAPGGTARAAPDHRDAERSRIDTRVLRASRRAVAHRR